MVVIRFINKNVEKKKMLALGSKSSEQSSNSQTTPSSDVAVSEEDKEKDTDLNNINNVQKEDFAPSENKKRYHRESFVSLLFEHIDLVFLFLTA